MSVSAADRRSAVRFEPPTLLAAVRGPSGRSRYAPSGGVSDGPSTRDVHVAGNVRAVAYCSSAVTVAAISRQKQFGAFYTPRTMARALVDWAVRAPTDTVLDPSFGGLVFLAAAKDRLYELGCSRPETQLFGADVDVEAVAEATDVAAAGATLIHRDFLKIAPDGRLLPRTKVVVGNPPYVRYQSWKEARERGREIAANHGVRLTRLASSWAPLLLHAADFAAPGGRLAQVLPAELIHAQYSDGVLDAVCARFGRVVVAMFDEHVFPGAQEEIVLLFAEDRGGRTGSVEVLSFRNIADLAIPSVSGPSVRIDSDHKLLAGLLDPAALSAYDRLSASGETRLLGDLASVDIGAVTGGNHFFVRPAEELAARGIPDIVLRPAISKATEIPGARLLGDEVRRRILVLEAEHYAHIRPLAELIAEGEQAGLHERYKCRIRTPWYAIPASQVAAPPHLFLTYMSSDVPRLVANDAAAFNTNTVHGVRVPNGTNPRSLAASFYNSLTLLSAEIVGRSYGGGVLKHEPTEAERIVMPRPSHAHEQLLDDVDRLLRARRYDELQDIVDQAVLVDDLGVPADDVARLRAAGDRLRGRRRARATSKAR